MFNNKINLFNLLTNIGYYNIIRKKKFIKGCFST